MIHDSGLNDTKSFPVAYKQIIRDENRLRSDFFDREIVEQSSVCHRKKVMSDINVEFYMGSTSGLQVTGRQTQPKFDHGILGRGFLAQATVQAFHANHSNPVAA